MSWLDHGIGRAVAAGLWCGLLAFVWLAAPPEAPGTAELVVRLLLFQLAGIEPWIVVAWNLVGVTWLGLAAVLVAETGREGNGRLAWLAIAASLGIGAFALLPYLVLRRSVPRPREGWPMREAKRGWIVLGVVGGGLACLVYGVGYGDPTALAEAWRSQAFVAVMSLDLLALWLVTPLVVDADRRRWRPAGARVAAVPEVPSGGGAAAAGGLSGWWSVVAVIPVVGLGAYLLRRLGSLPA